MPLATRVNATYEFILTTDADLPEKKRPVFIFRYISLKEWEDVANLDKQFGSTEDSQAMVDMALDIVKRSLVGWRNMVTPNGGKIAFNLKKLKNIISLPEAMELMQAVVAQMPSFEDKKKLDLPSPSNTGPSAKDVPVSQNARTSQAQASQSESAVPDAAALDAELAERAAGSKSSSARKR